jgi:capsular polysaccharide biosynthesis protein
MEIPRYLQILWNYRWLVLVGVLVSLIAGLLAGFTIRDGQVDTRAERSYTARSSIMLEAQQSTLLQAIIPGQEIDQTTTSAAVRQDLASVAILYAYLVTSEDIVDQVQEEIGDFADDEGMTAVSRTTQPNGDETFPGRLDLPIIEIVGIASSAARAEEIADTTLSVFNQYVVDEQTAELIPSDARVELRVLTRAKADAGVGGNPAVPIVLTFGGLLVAFIALVYILNGARTRRARRSAADDAEETSDESESDQPESDPEAAEETPAPGYRDWERPAANADRLSV